MYSTCTACNTCSLLSTRQLKVVFVLKVTYSFMLWLNERWVAKCTNQSVIREILHSVCVDRWTNVLILWKHALFYPSIHVCVLLCIVAQRYSFRVFLPYLKLFLPQLYFYLSLLHKCNKYINVKFLKNMVEDILYQKDVLTLESCQRLDGTVPVVSFPGIFHQSTCTEA